VRWTGSSRRGFAPHRDVQPRPGQADALAIERLLDAAAQLAPDFPLLQGDRLDPEAEIDVRLPEVVHADYFDRRQNRRRVLRVAEHRFGRLPHDRHDAIGVVCVIDPEIDHVVGVVLRPVGERLDLAVRDHVDDALEVAEDDRPQVDLFDEPAGAVDHRDVAHPHLILDDEEEAGDHVADQRLRAESHRKADDAGAGQHRRDVDIQLAENHQHGRRPDERRQAAARDARDGLRPLAAFEGIEAGADRQVALGADDDGREHAHDGERERGKRKDADARARRPPSEIPGMQADGQLDAGDVQRREREHRERDEERHRPQAAHRAGGERLAGGGIVAGGDEQSSRQSSGEKRRGSRERRRQRQRQRDGENVGRKAWSVGGWLHERG